MSTSTAYHATITRPTAATWTGAGNYTAGRAAGTSAAQATGPFGHGCGIGSASSAMACIEMAAEQNPMWDHWFARDIDPLSGCHIPFEESGYADYAEGFTDGYREHVIRAAHEVVAGAVWHKTRVGVYAHPAMRQIADSYARTYNTDLAEALRVQRQPC